MKNCYDKGIDMLFGILLVIITMFFLSACSKNEMRGSDQNNIAHNKIEVGAVKGRLGELGIAESTQKVCKNSTGTYIALENKIYMCNEGELILVVESDKGSISRVICTEKYLIYVDGEKDVVRLSIENGDKVVLFEDGYPEKMISNSEDYFITFCEYDGDGNEEYETFLFQNGSMEKQEITQNLADSYNNDFMYGSYEGYQLYGLKDNVSAPYGITYIRNNEWQMSNIAGCICMIDGEILRFGIKNGEVYYTYRNNEYVLDVLEEVCEGKTQIYGAFSSVKENKFYALVKYNGEYKNDPLPNPTGYEKDAIICILPDNNSQSVMYETKGKREKIVGCDLEKDYVYVYDDTNANISRINISTGNEEIIFDNLPYHTTLYFEWCGEEMYVFDIGGEQKLLAVLK